MNKEAKLILNSLRCPLCNSQIDLIDWFSLLNKKYKEHNFGCVVNPEHYSIYFNHWEDPPKIENERVIVYDELNQYNIDQNTFIIGHPWIKSTIKVSKVDKENRVLDNIKPKTYTFEIQLFDFKSVNRNKIINKVKTVLIFQ